MALGNLHIFTGEEYIDTELAPLLNENFNSLKEYVNRSSITFYSSLEEIDITPGQESFASIHSALPIKSALEYYVYADGNFNDEFYPVSNYYGVLQAVKLNGSKTVFSFYAHNVISGNEFSDLYLSAYHSSLADTTIWKKVALDSDLTNLSNSVVKSVNGIKPTNGNVLLPLIKNITTNQGVITFTKNDDTTIQVDNIKKLYPATLGESVDLNTLTESGAYFARRNAEVANYLNCPIQKAFFLEVQKIPEGNFVYQFLTQYNDSTVDAGNQYTRTYYNNNWSAWKKVALDSDLTNLSNNINRKSYNSLASLGLSYQTVTFADIINTLPVNSTLTFYVDVVTSEPTYAPNLQIPASGLVIVVKGKSNIVPTLFYLTPIVKGYTSYTGQYTTYKDYGFSGWQPMVLSVNAIKPNINGNVTIDIPKPVIASEAEAEAGTNNTKFMTPLRVAQALAANNGGIVSANLAQNGYVKFANGLILQWGYNSANLLAGNIVITFPTAYSKSVFSVVGVPTAALGSGDLAAYSITSVSQNNFTVVGDALTNGVKTSHIRWISVGC